MFSVGRLEMRTVKCLASLAVGLMLLGSTHGANAEEPYGIGLEGFPYPYPVAMLSLVNEGEPLRMAYMDVKPTAKSNGRTVLLLHGRNFPSSYWEPVIKTLTGAGFRVVAPDQIAFGKSSKPLFDLHFDQLVRNTVELLDQLKIAKVDVVAHSMGGMLAVRLARAYPDRIERLVLAAPIGLEDYRFYVPPVTTETLLEQEDKLTPDTYRRQLVTNYSLTLPPEAITPFVDARMRIKESSEYPRWLRSFVNSYQMIYREPVVHEIPLITQDTLFIMGGNDHNAPGRPFAPEAIRGRMGQNVALAQKLSTKMHAAHVEVIDGVGHLVFLEAQPQFNELMLNFLNAKQ
jgi:pimeloyl-ACP methyl ester carboxylesterase